MKKAYMVLNSTDVADLLWCLMNAPARTKAEERRHLKLHERLQKLQREMVIAEREAKLKKLREENQI